MEAETHQKKSSSGFGPGPALAKAREGLGLTQEEVAERLRLAPRQVLALETDDYDHLPGPTYVRGYLRSYAELVGLALDPILEAYGHVPASSKASDLGSLAPKEQITSQHRHVRFATYVMVALIIALAVTWWQGRTLRRKPVSKPVARSAAAGPAQSQAPTASTAVAPAAPASPRVLATPPPAAELPHQAPGTLLPAHPLAKAAGPAVLSRPMQVVIATKAAAGAGANGRALLVLSTVQDSWVDVRDAQGNKLLYETVPAGRVVTLDGNAPLKVFLGNAAGVKVEFDGKPFNPTPYMHGQVARFTLGAASSH